MALLTPPDTHHLSAAIGWLELGNHVEAGEELAKISAPFLEHLDILEVRWAICVAGKSWEVAAGVAELLLAKAPERVSAWIDRAYALRRMREGGLQQAWQALRPAFEKFPTAPIVPYNLACYAAQSGRLAEAWEWLQKAAASGGLKKIKQMALADADLQPLWEKIGQW